MNEQSLDRQQPERVDPSLAVWPPAPQGVGLTQSVLRLPFKTRYESVQGSVADFRTGFLDINQEGILIDGKAVTRMEVQVPILIVCLFFINIAFVIAYAVFEYGIRRPLALQIPWGQIQQIVLNTEKRRLCLVYFAPNEQGIVKTFSLATQLTPSEFSEAESTLRQFIPEKVVEGKTRLWLSPPLWILAGGLALAIMGTLFIVGIFYLGGLAQGGH